MKKFQHLEFSVASTKRRRPFQQTGTAAMERQTQPRPGEECFASDKWRQGQTFLVLTKNRFFPHLSLRVKTTFSVRQEPVTLARDKKQKRSAAS